MEIEKININNDGDYNIRYNDELIRCKGVIQVFSSNDDLDVTLNPNIIELLNSDECIHTEYVEYVASFEELKFTKLSELRNKRDGIIDYNDIQIDVSDATRFVPLMLLPEDEILLQLPIETESGIMIDSIELLTGICRLLVGHTKTYSHKIIECQKATTKTQLEDIIL